MNEHASDPGGMAPDRPGSLDVERARAMLGGDDSLCKIMEMAMQRLDEEVDAIAANLAVGDVSGASHMLHGIKGFAPLFCGDALADQITEVERLSKTADAQQVVTAYKLLAPALSGLRDDMRVFLSTKS